MPVQNLIHKGAVYVVANTHPKQLRWHTGPVGVKEIVAAFKKAHYMATAGTESVTVDVPHSMFDGDEPVAEDAYGAAEHILADVHEANGKIFGLKPQDAMQPSPQGWVKIHV